MTFLVIERFRDGNPVPVYARFAERGRMAPDGLVYVNSWTTRDLRTCYQVMACDDPALLEAWMAQWRDIVEFEVIEVMSSADAARTVAALSAQRATL